jgi:hypothetical protein
MCPVTDTPDPDPGAGEDAEALRREREWLLARLRDIPPERERLEELERVLVRNARDAGAGWDLIAAALGTEPGKARERFGEPEAGTVPF